ncbi:uncharacterized protein BO66DRAFT_392103 [Aspergillus aculeatinus CBS 121060]|uniref:Uncharacterized protein n=1 Tax=Aspergillus aculeatinus CBS 121060 TaxID=1448322 RepID=A0ACD1H980_9EURO|nr:hypothetical protein BO66DRAFT_392103 [Aspergillus aculeatinus CBS 121060]RAH70034.1 hypothetical protein BO66DRAFT_392103 [Aspergillus aculeatinus CBS 121060]
MKAAFALGAEAEFEQNQAQEVQEAQASDHPTEHATAERTPDDEADTEFDASEEEKEEEEEEEEEEEPGSPFIKTEAQEGLTAFRPAIVDEDPRASSSTTSSEYQSTERWDDQAPTTPPRYHNPVNFTAEDLRLRLSSNFGLYVGLDANTISGKVEVALYQSLEPHLASIRLRRTKRINPKMIDIYVNSAREREHLIQCAEKWVPCVKEHQYVHPQPPPPPPFPPPTPTKRQILGDSSPLNRAFKL